MDKAMMEACEEVMTQMGHTISQSTHSTHNVIGRTIMATGLSRLFTNPLVMFAAGAAVGYFGYKHRKEIAEAVARASNMSKDFMLQQKESLEDIMEETREAAEEGHKAEG